jgi:hypothetical protein
MALFAQRRARAIISEDGHPGVAARRNKPAAAARPTTTLRPGP